MKNNSQVGIFNKFLIDRQLKSLDCIRYSIKNRFIQFFISKISLILHEVCFLIKKQIYYLESLQSFKDNGILKNDYLC